MPNQDPAETSSLFSLSKITEGMKEKKNGALRTTKMNASIAAKIRTKAINNSSILKVTLKQNNKALALAVTAAKREARELTKEKMFLQKEVKQGDFERARLRQKLLAVVNRFVQIHQKHNEYMEELQQFLNSELRAIVELSSPSERDSCSLLLSDERLSTIDMKDNQADDNRPIRTAPKAMRIPLCQDDNKCENGKGDLVSTSQLVLPLQLPTLAVGEPLKSVANPAEEKASCSHLTDESLANSEKNGQPSGEVDGAALALDLDVIFGGNPSSIPQSSRSCSLSVLNNNNKLEGCSEIKKSHDDQRTLLLGHVTERRKRTTGCFASFREASWMELPDNGLGAGLTLPEEMKPAEISQVGKLVTLKAQKKSHKKTKTSEAETPKKKSMGRKGRNSSTSNTKGNLEDCNEVAAPNTTQPKVLGSNTRIVSQSAEVSAQVDCLEKSQLLNSHGQNEGLNSQCFYKIIGLSTVHVDSPCHVEDVSFSENSSSNAEHTSQHSDKAGACEKISVVDLAPPNGKTGTQEPKSKAQVEKFDLLSPFQSPDSISLLGSPPHAFSGLLDDAFSDGECRKWFKIIPKMQGFSTSWNTTLLKTNSSSLEKTCQGVGSQVTDFKRVGSKSKANRKVHTENNVKDLSLDSHHMTQAAKGQKTPARSCALPKMSAVVSKNHADSMPSGTQEKTMQETPKESSPKRGPHQNENNILKDLTNAAQTLCHSTLLEEPLTCRGGRARKQVNYEEPKLNRKLRRGDPLANSDFFSCPIYKTTKKKKTKSEAISKESSSDPVPRSLRKEWW